VAARGLSVFRELKRLQASHVAQSYPPSRRISPQLVPRQHSSRQAKTTAEPTGRPNRHCETPLNFRRACSTSHVEGTWRCRRGHLFIRDLDEVPSSLLHFPRNRETRKHIRKERSECRARSPSIPDVPPSGTACTALRQTPVCMTKFAFVPLIAELRSSDDQPSTSIPSTCPSPT
jgi:hypothetical protein